MERDIEGNKKFNINKEYLKNILLIFMRKESIQYMREINKILTIILSVVTEESLPNIRSKAELTYLL
jgi:hypothetical protein